MLFHCFISLLGWGGLERNMPSAVIEESSTPKMKIGTNFSSHTFPAETCKR